MRFQAIRHGLRALCIVGAVLGFICVTPPSVEAKPMDVTEALRLMRQAKASSEAGDRDIACSLYDRVVARFPTWWMSLVGRVECGLDRNDDAQELALMLAKAERYEGPAEIIAQLRARLLRQSGKIHELCALLLPAAVKGKAVSLPLQELLIYAWLKGRLGDSTRLVMRMRSEGSVDAASLRLGAEAALLTKDATAVDILLPAFLKLHPELVLMVRYIRDLERRGDTEGVALWTQEWADLVRTTLPARSLRR